MDDRFTFDNQDIVIVEYCEKQGAFHVRELKELKNITRYTYGDWSILGPLPLMDTDIFSNACHELVQRRQEEGKKLKLKQVRRLYDNYLSFITGLISVEESIAHKIMRINLYGNEKE